jgi:hypothetical protein
LTIYMINPTGKIQRSKATAMRRIGSLEGKKVGFVFNQHGTAAAFWQKLESSVQQRFQPEGVSRIYKDNTWSPADTLQIQRLAHETDYVLVGVGA